MIIVIHRTEYDWHQLFELAESEGYGVAKISRILNIHVNTLHNIKHGLSKNPAHTTVDMLEQFFDQVLLPEDFAECLYKKTIIENKACDNKAQIYLTRYDWGMLVLKARSKGVSSGDLSKATGMSDRSIRDYVNNAGTPKRENQRTLFKVLKQVLTTDEINSCRLT